MATKQLRAVYFESINGSFLRMGWTEYDRNLLTPDDGEVWNVMSSTWFVDTSSKRIIFNGQSNEFKDLEIKQENISNWNEAVDRFKWSQDRLDIQVVLSVEFGMRNVPIEEYNFAAPVKSYHPIENFHNFRVGQLKEMLSSISDDDFIMVQADSHSGNSYPIAHIEDSTSIGFWELRFDSSRDFWNTLNEYKNSGKKV